MTAFGDAPDPARSTSERAAAKATDVSLDRLQKLAVVEQLAGGIAHDCNNAFQNILASMELVRKLIATGRASESERFVASAMNSAQRATASLQLWFNFARYAAAERRVLDSRATLAAVGELFRRSLPTPAGVELDLATDLWEVVCDPHELQTSVLALALHARAASPDERPIVVRARNLVVDAGAAGAFAVREGEYLAVSVTHSGASDAAARQTFDAPPRDESHGLRAIDLSVVRNFARQNGGDATVRTAGSERIDDGTTITLCLPRATGAKVHPADSNARDS